MSDDTTTQRKFAQGTVRIVESVQLPQRPEDEAPRTMGVVWIEENGGTPERYTDFSSMHKGLAVDRPVRVVFEEKHELRGDSLRVHRNLVTMSQD